MYLATRVYCASEWAVAPDLFIVEIGDGLLKALRKYIKAARQLRKQLDNAFFSVTCDSTGNWIEDSELAETILGNADYRFIRNVPDNLEEAGGIRGHRVTVYPDGDVCFKSYNNWSGEEFESVMVPAKMLLASDIRPEYIDYAAQQQ
jgi:hypothetical protein